MLRADELPDGWQHDYAGRCWWCGVPADSREHKWKKSDIVRMYGSGPYGHELVWGNDDGDSRIVQGPRSPELKYKAVLCQRCNTTRSQPFDLAYDMWSEYVSDGLDVIKDWTKFDFTRVYSPANCKAQLTNLAGYFVKQIGCQLAEVRVKVPQDFIDFLDGRLRRPRRIQADLGISDGTIWIHNHVRDEGETESWGGLFKRGIECDYRPSAGAIAETRGSVGTISYVEVLWHVKHIDDPPPGWARCFSASRQRMARGYDGDPTEALRILEES